jgi:hypothetical protein
MAAQSAAALRCGSVRAASRRRSEVAGIALHDEVDVSREPPRRGTADPAILGRSGVEQMRSYLTGESPLPAAMPPKVADETGAFQ